MSLQFWCNLKRILSALAWTAQSLFLSPPALSHTVPCCLWLQIFSWLCQRRTQPSHQACATKRQLLLRLKAWVFFGGHSPSVSELINFSLSAKTLSSNQLVTLWVYTLLERRGAHLSFFKTSQFVLRSHISAGGVDQAAGVRVRDSSGTGHPGKCWCIPSGKRPVVVQTAASLWLGGKCCWWHLLAGDGDVNACTGSHCFSQHYIRNVTEIITNYVCCIIFFLLYLVYNCNTTKKKKKSVLDLSVMIYV